MGPEAAVGATAEPAVAAGGAIPEVVAAAPDEATKDAESASLLGLALAMPIPEVIKGLLEAATGGWDVKPDDGLVDGPARLEPPADAGAPTMNRRHGRIH